MEVILAEYADGGLGGLHGDIELIAPLLPDYLQRVGAIEGHLLGRAGIATLGYLHPPEGALELAAELREIFECEG